MRTRPTTDGVTVDVHDSDDVIDLDGDEAPRLVAGPRARLCCGGLGCWVWGLGFRIEGPPFRFEVGSSSL